MSDQFVVVATYALAPEAQLAVNLLESAGIEAMLDGDYVGGAFAGMSALGDQLRVRVRAGDAPRATSLLAQAQAHVELIDDWEDRAEAVPTCSLCGNLIPEGFAECPACRTPRDAIRSEPVDTAWGVRRPGSGAPAGEGIQAGDQVTAAAPAPVAPPASEEDTPNQETQQPRSLAGAGPLLLGLLVLLGLLLLAAFVLG
jgi:hypothetical protein